MKTNLIQNYVYNASRSAQNRPDYDIQKIIDTNTFIQPLPSRGKLVDGKLSAIPELMVKDALYDFKAFKHAACGKANDHELGKLNDVGLKLGSLAIAGYLFKIGKSPLSKSMEFVGLSTFLASMTLWPKLAIQLPAYLIHGVNVGKKYEDSFGRIKSFYQDPQFIPWDLYSDEEINKMGDRLKVPQNIPNRRDFIQEKMKKIALQNNTLWMLTAGFAAPIMSALICNVSEPYVTKLINCMYNKEADYIINNFNLYTSKHKQKSAEAGLENLFKNKQDNRLDDNLKQEIKSILTKPFDLVTTKSFNADFDAKFVGNKFYADRGAVTRLLDELKEIFTKNNYNEDFIKALLTNEQNIADVLTKHELLNKDIDNEDFQNIKTTFIKEVKSNYDKYYQEHPQFVQEDWKQIKALILNHPQDSHPLTKAFKKTHSEVFDKSMFEQLKVLAKDIDIFTCESSALDRYAILKTGAAPQTVSANFWNKFNSDLIKDVFKFTPDEISKANLDENVMNDILRNKFEKIVSNDEQYKRVLKSVVKKFSLLDEDIKSKDLVSHILHKQDRLGFDEKQKARTLYDRLTDDVFDGFADKMKNNGFTSTAKAIAGINRYDESGTAKTIQKSYIQDRLLGIKSAFYRLINTLDFYKRVAADANNIPGIKNQCRNIKEELIELCKIITLEGHSSDHSTKFYMKRNPNPLLNDSSAVEVINGKVKNKYFGKIENVADIPGDKYFYQNAMIAMYQAPMHPDTQAIIDNSVLKTEMSNYREIICERLGGENYFVKPRHRIRNSDTTGSNIKFLLNGISPKEMLFKSNQQIYNTRKWLKMFGTAGAVLLGITVFAQFFFGKMRDFGKVSKK